MTEPVSVKLFVRHFALPLMLIPVSFTSVTFVKTVKSAEHFAPGAGPGVSMAIANLRHVVRQWTGVLGNWRWMAPPSTSCIRAVAFGGSSLVFARPR